MREECLSHPNPPFASFFLSFFMAISQQIQYGIQIQSSLRLKYSFDSRRTYNSLPLSVRPSVCLPPFSATCSLSCLTQGQSVLGAASFVRQMGTPTLPSALYPIIPCKNLIQSSAKGVQLYCVSLVYSLSKELQFGTPYCKRNSLAHILQREY